MSEKAAVLIDGNYYEIMQQVLDVKLDIVKFSDFICGNYKRFRTYYYDALPWIPPHPNAGQSEKRADKQRFFDYLAGRDRVQVRQEGRVDRYVPSCKICEQQHGQKLFKCENCDATYEKKEQKLVDVLLSVDLTKLAFAKQVDKIILIAGDSDFIPAVMAAKEAGAIVKLVYAKHQNVNTHHQLIKTCDERLMITPSFIELNRDTIKT